MSATVGSKLVGHSGNDELHIEYLRRVAYLDQDGNPLPAATFASAIAILRPTEPRPA